MACHPNPKDNSFYGLAIGLTVMADLFSWGLSGGVFNPAVSIGPSIVDFISGTGVSQYFTWYYSCSIIGSLLLYYILTLYLKMKNILNYKFGFYLLIIILIGVFIDSIEEDYDDDEITSQVKETISNFFSSIEIDSELDTYDYITEDFQLVDLVGLIHWMSFGL